MPATYAHYRFGQTAALSLSGNARKAVGRFRQLYDVGLHGPDLFFYYNPLWKTRIGTLGKTMHRMSGQELFGSAARMIRSGPNEGGTAYLYGLLAHYALDRVCHPLINELSADGKITHTQIETEFDRFLLELDGKLPPCRQDLGTHIRLTAGECITVASFYPGAGPAAISQCVSNMARVNRILAAKNRKLLEKTFSLAGQQDMVMPQRRNRNCAHLNEPLLQRYEKALEDYSRLAEELSRCLRDDAPLSEEFIPAFQ